MVELIKKIFKFVYVSGPKSLINYSIHKVFVKRKIDLFINVYFCFIIVYNYFIFLQTSKQTLFKD